MKDDFYKDIEHKRASQEKKDKDRQQKKEKDQEHKETMRRADRHKQKEKPGADAPKDKETGSPFKSIGQSLSSRFNRASLDKGKAFFIGKLALYNKRIRNELKVSKEKLSEFRNQKKRPEQKVEEEGGRRTLPIAMGGILILPITVILGVMIISNFWPTGDDAAQVADNEEETMEAEDASGEVSEDLEEQKAEMEREVAESREEGGQNDLGTGSIDYGYSEDEAAELEDAALAAIEEKESGDADGSDASVVEEPEEETAEGPAEDSAEEETAEPDSEEAADETEESTAGAQTHVVSAEDNLFRIAIRYYGSGSPENVNKIREANGISGNSLSPGQELVIPE